MATNCMCRLRQASAQPHVLRPSDFVAVVNYTNPDIDMDALFESGEYEALPYQDGSFTPNANPSVRPLQTEAAPFSVALFVLRRRGLGIGNTGGARVVGPNAHYGD